MRTRQHHRKIGRKAVRKTEKERNYSFAICLILFCWFQTLFEEYFFYSTPFYSFINAYSSCSLDFFFWLFFRSYTNFRRKFYTSFFLWVLCSLLSRLVKSLPIAFISQWMNAQIVSWFILYVDCETHALTHIISPKRKVHFKICTYARISVTDLYIIEMWSH